MVNKITDKLNGEPVALAALFIAAVGVVTAFVPMDDIQQSALIVFASALAGFFARSKVSPV
jgi:hypothetical protein